jgi:Tfp pilus assembly protein PilF
MTRRLLILGGLTLLTLLVFGRVLDHGFVFDDVVYVTGSAPVQAGLTAEGIVWAFTTLDNAFWHPLTWLSLMLDSTLYGGNPAGWHLTSLLIHLASTLLLFLILESMTGASGRSAVVAALFAIHPLHVESVAWVSERKDVLAALFWIATMGAYLRYVRKPGPRWYAALFTCYLLGMMAKPMLVTLPFALLLLDVWPLKRIDLGDLRWARLRRPIVEKLPLLIPIPFFSAISVIAQHQFGAVGTAVDYPLGIRVGNALATYGTYLFKTLIPIRLAAFYPHPGGDLSLPLVIGSTVALLAATAGVLRHCRRHPWLFTGWFWYLGTLVPVIGLVQLGRMGMADRFTYLPLIGIFIIAAWGIPKISLRLGASPRTPGILAAAALILYAPLAWIQAGYWRDNVTLFTRTLAVTEKNFLAHYNLGEALETEGKLDEAAFHYRKAMEFDPWDFRAHTNLGTILARGGDLGGAASLYRRALEVEPAATPTMYNLATILSEMGEEHLPEAKRWMLENIRLDPTSAGWNNLGVILSRMGDGRGASEAFALALALDPANQTARDNLEAERGTGGRP